LIFDEVKGGFLATVLLIATYGGASGKKWPFLVGMETEEGERVPEASAVSWSHYWFGAMTMSPLTGVRGA
jgi:hypothetical protein